MLNKTKFTITPDNCLGNAGDYFQFSFGCAAEPDKDGAIRLINGTHTCREGLMSSMRSRINEGANNQPTDKMRMIFRFGAGSGTKRKPNLEKIEGWMNRTIPVLQAFDKIAGWPLTRVYKINTNHEEWLRAYYTHSSRRWMKSSYLVSLYTLLVRMCQDERITGFKDFDGLYKKIDGIIKNAGGSGKQLVSDHGYVKSSLQYWKALMVGYPRLFRQYKMSHYWDTAKVGGRTGSEGIQYLTGGNTNYTAIRTELTKIKGELDKGTFDPTPPKPKKK